MSHSSSTERGRCLDTQTINPSNKQLDTIYEIFFNGSSACTTRAETRESEYITVCSVLFTASQCLYLTIRLVFNSMPIHVVQQGTLLDTFLTIHSTWYFLYWNQTMQFLCYCMSLFFCPLDEIYIRPLNHTYQHCEFPLPMQISCKCYYWCCSHYKMVHCDVIMNKYETVSERRQTFAPQLRNKFGWCPSKHSLFCGEASNALSRNGEDSGNVILHSHFGIRPTPKSVHFQTVTL